MGVAHAISFSFILFCIFFGRAPKIDLPLFSRDFLLYPNFFFLKKSEWELGGRRRRRETLLLFLARA